MVLVDDLVFGWIFWGIAQWSPVASAAIGFFASWSVSFWLVVQGVNENPGKLATHLLKSLELERSNPELRMREDSVKNKITSVGVAIPMCLLFGGIVPTLWLWKRDVVSHASALRVGFLLCGFYAVEFALVHGLGIGGSIFFVRQ